MITDVAKKDMITQFEVGYMLLPSLKKNKSFREQAENTFSEILNSQTPQDIKTTTKKYKYHERIMTMYFHF